MSEYLIEKQTLTDIADAIRVFNADSNSMTAVEMSNKLTLLYNELIAIIEAQQAKIEEISAIINSKSKKMISFVVLSSTGEGVLHFQAEEGMSWEDWFGSDYNPDFTDAEGTFGRFTNYYGRVADRNGYLPVYNDRENENETYPQDLIISDGIYYLEEVPGGNVYPTYP